MPRTSAARFDTRTRWFAIAVCVVAAAVIAMALSFLRWPDPDNVAVYDDNGSGMDARLSGQLSVTPECVTVSAAGEVWTPVFPRGSVAIGGDTLVWDDKEVPTGNPIELGGGEASGLGDYSIPDGCPRDHLWLVTPN